MSEKNYLDTLPVNIRTLPRVKEHGFGMTDKYLKGTPYAPHMSQAEGLPTAPIFVSVWERVILNTFAYCGWIPYVF